MTAPAKAPEPDEEAWLAALLRDVAASGAPEAVKPALSAALAEAAHAEHRPVAPGAAPRALFGLHMPRCGGTSLLRMFEATLPADAVHQSTSLHRNWAEGRPAFPEIARPARLRLVFGHWVHEEMLHALPQALRFTALRDPLERLESHYRFAARLAARQGRPVPAPEEWLGWQGPNPMCRFLTARFPTLAGTSGSDFERARAVLACFDVVLFPDTLESAGTALARAAGLAGAPGHENAVPGAAAQLPVGMARIEDDRRLLEWAREAFPGPEGRRRADAPPALAEFLGGRPRPDRLAWYLCRAERAELAAFGALDAARGEAARKARFATIRQQALSGGAEAPPPRRRRRPLARLAAIRRRLAPAEP